MRVLLHEDPAWVGREVTEDDLPDLYAAPARGVLRANMIATLDGAATGPDGRSGTINNEVDHAVFATLRQAADVVVVGAGTARAEGYGPVEVPLVLVSSSADVPAGLLSAEPGQVLLATTTGSAGLSQARALLGAEHVLTVGEGEVDPAALRAELEDRGWRSILTEGGPALLTDLVAAGVVDELCLTWVPRLLGGEHPRLLAGAEVDVALQPALLLEHEGTLLGRWRVGSGQQPG
jgi:riboflavin biosynthesis pyrimidine reductase